MALEILECTNCGLVRLSSFEHIDDQFYEESDMHNSSKSNLDISVWLKDTEFDDERRFVQYAEMIKNKDILDFGCGAGGFLLKARNSAKSVCGVELEKSLYGHFKQSGLYVCNDIDSLDKTVDEIFLFHVLEHIGDPFSLLEKLKRKLNPGGQIIVEVPNADDALLTLYQSKAFSEFTYWSPHLYLYNASTLRLLANKATLKTAAIRQEQRYPLSNHLYWLSMGKPGGHLKWQFLNMPDLDSAYKNVLAAIGKCDTLVGYFYI
jgi:cyclopropane fatty-acyl-phospholipid synthase-like methyltransferase